MRRSVLLLRIGVLSASLLLLSCEKEPSNPVDVGLSPTAQLAKSGGTNGTRPTVTVFSTGFNNPRGLKFGPDGYLYVAEGGLGGSLSTRGQCDSVIAPIGPYTGGMTGRISRVDRLGMRTTFSDNLPSDQTSPGSGSLVSGVADVEFIGRTLYAILAGGGCSHGVSGIPNALLKIEKNGSWSVAADLSQFLQTHPVASPEADDFEPDGTWYSMVRVGADLFAVEPNHGEIDRIDPRDHRVSRFVDVSASQGHIVPTALTRKNGNFYFGNLHTFPIVDGSSNVYRVSRSGQITVLATGFTTILGLLFDADGGMYVLENTTGGNPFPTPGTGTILRVNPSGSRDTIATSLFLPTAMTFGPDGDLYVSNKGFGPPIPGFGEILRISIPRSKHDRGDREGDED